MRLNERVDLTDLTVILEDYGSTGQLTRITHIKDFVSQDTIRILLHFLVYL